MHRATNNNKNNSKEMKISIRAIKCHRSRKILLSYLKTIGSEPSEWQKLWA